MSSTDHSAIVAATSIASSGWQDVSLLPTLDSNTSGHDGSSNSSVSPTTSAVPDTRLAALSPGLNRGQDAQQLSLVVLVVTADKAELLVRRDPGSGRLASPICGPLPTSCRGGPAVVAAATQLIQDALREGELCFISESGQCTESSGQDPSVARGPSGPRKRGKGSSSSAQPQKPCNGALGEPSGFGDHGTLRFASVLKASDCSRLDWVFELRIGSRADLFISARMKQAGVQFVDQGALDRAAYGNPGVDGSLQRAVRLFRPLGTSLRRSAVASAALVPGPPRDAWDAANLEDRCLLDPCHYMFDNPGKGVRSQAVRALASHFAIHRSDLDALASCIEQYHGVSLIIDDIEDESQWRRNQPCAHVQFGVPAALNSAYFLTFKILDAVPRLFRGHHQATQQLLLDGLVRIHRGQGQDIVWRDAGYCPSEEEYLGMVRGKTSTPFVLAARLFFLHATDWRVWASAQLASVVRLVESLFGSPPPLGSHYGAPVEQQVCDLFDQLGVYFQVRDDYINLADAEYWEKKGFCDDIHERKFSFPIIYMVHHRCTGADWLMSLFGQPHAPVGAVLGQALDVIRGTAALSYTYDYLVRLRNDVLERCKSLQIDALATVVKNLSLKEPYMGPIPNKYK